MNVPKLRFKEFTDKWEEKKLGEVSNFLDGKRKPLKDSDRNNRKGIYPYYGASGIIDYIDDYIFDKELILLGEDGANILTRNTRLAFLARGKYWVNNHAHVIEGKKYVNQYFLCEYLEKLDYTQYNTGTAQPKLNQEICKNILIKLPNLKEQEKIADFLSNVDKKISITEEKLNLFNEYKKGIMRKIFNQELRFKDSNGNDYPKWEKRKLGKISKIYDGTHQTPNYVEKGVPFYSVENITNNNFWDTKYVSEETYVENNKKRKIEKNDILMTRIGSIGETKLVDWSIKADFYVSLALIKLDENSYSSYINQFIKSEFFQKELDKRTLKVAFPQKINLSDIGECLVKLPCLEEQQKIADFLSSIDNKIEKIADELENLKEFKKGLLQKMFI